MFVLSLVRMGGGQLQPVFASVVSAVGHVTSVEIYSCYFHCVNKNLGTQPEDNEAFFKKKTLGERFL